LEIEFDYVPRLPQAPLPSVKLLQLGKVTAFFDGVVVIRSVPGVPALDRDSALYFADRRPMGLVYDIIGQVKQPSYVVIYENRRQTSEKRKGKASTAAQEIPPCPVKIEVDVKVGDEIYYADDAQLSIKVLTDQLQQSKAYDEGDPNEEFYSDDEEERKAKGTKQPQMKATKGVPRGGRRGRAVKRNRLSRIVRSQSVNHYPRHQQRQHAYQSYIGFYRQWSGGPSSTYQFGGGGEQVRFAQSQLSGSFGMMPPPPQQQQQGTLPNMSFWQLGQVNFPLNIGHRFPFPSNNYSMGHAQSMPPTQSGPQRYGYPNPTPPPPSHMLPSLYVPWPPTQPLPSPPQPHGSSLFHLLFMRRTHSQPPPSRSYSQYWPF
uniref:H/ACA ribonucleoprotein complex non-core subunit NAF1 n=1 Tax=Rodentolepis nana TaxID=102285 RepID=A0A0R3T7E7_RODNA